MAKTFKHLTQSAAATPKPVSERDFFDLTDEEATALPTAEASAPPATDANNIGKTPHTRNSGNTGKQIVQQPVPSPAAAPDPDEDRDIRQTFVVGSRYLERLRDHVHARRVAGDYEYSQKQALQEALDLLFGSVDPVPPRPAQARASEQRRSERIRRGRSTSSGQ